ncbi:MAG: hypothetical protein M0Q15_10235 [Nevskia sp.]|jgi:pilus assembly protein FimV|nr:hypothetical protein [Nevskia sp.]
MKGSRNDRICGALSASPELSISKSGNSLLRPLIHACIGIAGLGQVLPAAALAIGEPRQVSQLFEPLRVEIPIEGSGDADLRVRLTMISSSREAVAADIGSTSITSSLRQELITGADGHRFLRITSQQIMNEPVLTLHVDVAEQGIQIRRELTLLFDPPSTSPHSTAFAAAEPAPTTQATQAAVSSASTAQVASIGGGETAEPAATTATPDRKPALTIASASVGASKPVARNRRHRRNSNVAAVAPAKHKPLATAAPNVKVPATPAVAALLNLDAWQNYGPVQIGETIAQVADKLRPTPDLPVTTMAALLRWLNPDAFSKLDGELRVGATLFFPNPTVLATLMPAEHPAIVATEPTLPATAARNPEHGVESASRRNLAPEVPLAANTANVVAVNGFSGQGPASALTSPVPGTVQVFPSWLIATMLSLTAATFGVLIQMMRIRPRRFTVDETPGIQQPAMERDAAETAAMPEVVARNSEYWEWSGQAPRPSVRPELAAPVELPKAVDEIDVSTLTMAPDPEPVASSIIGAGSASIAPDEADVWNPDQFDLLLPDNDGDTVRPEVSRLGWQVTPEPSDNRIEFVPDENFVKGQVRHK